jgi:hypothetical protein
MLCLNKYNTLFKEKVDVFICFLFCRLKSIIQEVARDHRDHFHRYVLAFWKIPLFLFVCCSKASIA